MGNLAFPCKLRYDQRGTRAVNLHLHNRKLKMGANFRKVSGAYGNYRFRKAAAGLGGKHILNVPEAGFIACFHTAFAAISGQEYRLFSGAAVQKFCALQEQRQAGCVDNGIQAWCWGKSLYNGIYAGTPGSTTGNADGNLILSKSQQIPAAA